MSVEIKEIKSKSEAKQFVSIPFDIYKGSKFWVPPLKKGELKITVIASSFPDNQQRVMGKSSSLFQGFNSSANSEEERGKGKIFNTVSPSKATEESVANQVKKSSSGTPPAEPIEDNDDWSAVPAFLRRSKLK